MVDRPLLTLVVPTMGRTSLYDTLQSVAQQPRAHEVELHVVVDGHQGRVDRVPPDALVGPLWDYHWTSYDAGYSCWGHPQRNFGYSRACGLFIACLDDDDIWAPTALDSILNRVTDYPENIHIFKMRYMESGSELWRWPHMRLGNVGSPMIVVPNNREKLGTWTDVYEGDYQFLLSTVANYGSEDSIKWWDPVIAYIRPRDP